MQTVQRYCVALVLPQPLGKRLDRARNLLQPSRRHMPAHVTLVAPLALSDDDAERASFLVRQAAASHPAMHLVLRGADSFTPRSSTVYLCVADGADQMRMIAADLDRAPFPERMRPLSPHVTIASRASRSVMSAALTAFDDFHADCVIDAITLFVLTDDGWTTLSEGRMGGSRP